MKAIQSQKTDSHGTPEAIVKAARHTLGEIDLDPASSEEFNLIVQASRYFTQDDDGLSKLWLGRIFLNPPGGESGSVVKRFWEKLVASHELGSVTSGIWVGFNINQLQQLQRSKAGVSPHDYPMCIPGRRISFIGKAAKTRQQAMFPTSEVDVSSNNQPPHSNFITLLPDGTRGQLRRFREAFGEIGTVRT